jgi:P27 family predicted phage terminase small subunit
MPRQSAAALAVPMTEAKPRYLTPPSGLSAEARGVFSALVTAVDPKHFTPADEPLLVEYVNAILLARKAAEALEKAGAVLNGKPNPWLVVQEKAVRAMTALALRLRLSPQSRFDTRAAGRHARATAPSYYEIGDQK